MPWNTSLLCPCPETFHWGALFTPQTPPTTEAVTLTTPPPSDASRTHCFAFTQTETLKHFNAALSPSLLIEVKFLRTQAISTKLTLGIRTLENQANLWPLKNSRGEREWRFLNNSLTSMIHSLAIRWSTQQITLTSTLLCSLIYSLLFFHSLVLLFTHWFVFS